MSAFVASPLKGPSPRSFFTDIIQPESFSSIDKWNQVRDFLFYFGAKYKDKLSVESGVYHGRRRYAYSIGKYMNIIQHGYSEYIQTTTLNGRLFVENFCGIFAPTVGFPSSDMTTGEKLKIIKTISVELENIVKTYCKVINKGGNGDAHEHVAQIPVSDKGIIVDNIFHLCSYIMRHYSSRWPDDSERAKQWMTNPRVFQNRLRPSLDDKVTSIQLWLADNGLDDCRAAFIANGVYDVETLLYIKEEGVDTVQELLQVLNLPLGLKVLFKRKLAEVSSDTVEEYRQALLDLLAALQMRQEEDMLRKAQEDEMKRAQEVEDMLRKAQEDEMKRAQEEAAAKAAEMKKAQEEAALKKAQEEAAKAAEFTGRVCERTLGGHSSYVRCLVKLADGRVVSGSLDNTLKVWNVNTGVCEKTLEGHRDAVDCLVQLADGRVVSGSHDSTLKVWNMNTGVCERTLNGHSHWVECLVQLSDGRVVSDSFDKTLKVWNVNTGVCERTLEGHSNRVRCLVQLSDGRVVSGSEDSTLKVWNTNTGVCERTLEGHRYNTTVRRLVQLSDGRVVSGSTDNTLKVWK